MQDFAGIFLSNRFWFGRLVEHDRHGILKGRRQDLVGPNRRMLSFNGVARHGFNSKEGGELYSQPNTI